MIKDTATTNSPKGGAWSFALIAIILASACGIVGCGGSSAESQHGSSNAPATSSSSALARGRALYQSDGCEGCHSLNGTRVVGPSWRGLAGSKVELTNGQTVTANRAYLTRHIVQPNAMTVQGYPAGVMAQAIESLDLPHKPQDVSALVAFIESIK